MNFSLKSGIYQWVGMVRGDMNHGGDYINNDPMAEHWQLVTNPCYYKYSTCNYYNMGEITYTFIKDLRDEF